jgi:hypothetical protein
MNVQSLLSELEPQGHVRPEQITLWRESADLLAILEAIGRAGASAVVKIDGARRDGSVYSVVVSGGPLGEDFYPSRWSRSALAVEKPHSLLSEEGVVRDGPMSDS